MLSPANKSFQLVLKYACNEGAEVIIAFYVRSEATTENATLTCKDCEEEHEENVTSSEKRPCPRTTKVWRRQESQFGAPSEDHYPDF